MEDIFLKKAEKKGFKALFSQFLTGIFFIICASIILEVIIAGAEGRTPQFFGYSISYVPTESMEPTINAGDYVLSHNVKFEQVNVDDIIIYKSNSGRLIIHRIIVKTDEYIICQGDNNPIPDSEMIYPDMVKGIYIKQIQALKIFSNGINQNIVYLILIILFIILIVTQIISIILKSRTDDLINKKKELENIDKEELLKKLHDEVLAEELEKRNQNHKKGE